MGLSNLLSCEAGSFFCLHNPHRFFQPKVLRLSFPVLELWVARSVSLPSCSSRFICREELWDCPVCQLPPCPSGPPASTLPRVLSALAANLHLPPVWMNFFFFNSLVVGLPCSSIFCQFWLFFVFKFVVVLLLVEQGGKVYLPILSSWLEV